MDIFLFISVKIQSAETQHFPSAIQLHRDLGCRFHSIYLQQQGPDIRDVLSLIKFVHESAVKAAIGTCLRSCGVDYLMFGSDTGNNKMRQDGSPIDLETIH